MTLQRPNLQDAATRYADTSVLVVDDDPIIRQAIAVDLLDMGVASVREASNGEAALRQVALTVPDLILCDVGMEPMDGIELLKRLRAMRITDVGRVKFVFLTGDSKVETVAAARELRADGYLVKPVGPDTLKKRIDALFAPSHGALDRRKGVVWN